MIGLILEHVRLTTDLHRMQQMFQRAEAEAHKYRARSDYYEQLYIKEKRQKLEWKR